ASVCSAEQRPSGKEKALLKRGDPESAKETHQKQTIAGMDFEKISAALSWPPLENSTFHQWHRVNYTGILLNSTALSSPRRGRKRQRAAQIPCRWRRKPRR
ncbi:hypothetical protein, partial [Accumulibacter sp.]|uniref:hypothetical protein n=1 Tax=Accumulibacter sp. TaxID=2053492 RepID=UPI00287A6C74